MSSVKHPSARQRWTRMARSSQLSSVWYFGRTLCPSVQTINTDAFLARLPPNQNCNMSTKNICVIVPINRKLRTKAVCHILPGLHKCCQPKPGDQQESVLGRMAWGVLKRTHKMNEWMYVLTVEALFFGLLSTVLTAQRINVFTWPTGHLGLSSGRVS